MKKSIFGNLKINNENNCPKKILHLNFDDVALGALDEQTARNYNQSIAPGNLNSSVMDSFFGSGYVLECQGIIDTEVASAAAFEAILENSLVTVPGPHGSNVTALFQEIKSKALDPGTNPWQSPSQTWVRILRAAPGDVVPPAIDTMYISQWRKMQIPPAVTLANFLDYTDPSGVAFSCTILEAKTGGYAGVEPAGDYRFSVRIEEDVDGLYWSTRGDDFANNAAVPGVPNVVNRRFWREDTHTPIPPSDTWFFLEALIERGMATNRTLVQVTIAGVTYVICDKQSSGSLISTTDAQEGIQRLPWTRIFLGGLYSDSLPDNYPLNSYIADVQVWDSAPRFMGWSEPVAVDTSLAGGTTQPREGTDTLSIDFTSSTPTQVTIARNDNSEFAVYPDGNLSQYFTPRTGGIDFAVSLAHMNLGVNTIGVKASYADYRKATDSISVTIEEVVEVDPEEISVAMAGGLTQYQAGIDTLQITFVNGSPIAVNLARNAETTFAQWPTGNLSIYFTEVPGGLEFDLSLAHLNIGENSIGVTATYSDASTADAFLTLHISEVPAEEPPPDPTPPSPLPAFPGAEGFGAASVGGRGGAVLFVTNLNDSGAGSLREALLTTGPRTVIFRVGGTIDLLSDISLSGASLSYLTVAGQTAPGGIQTRYKTIEMSNGIHDVIFRFVRHRRGWEDYTPGEAESNNHGPGLTIYSYGSPCYNIIIDHCSFAWQQDDNSFWQSVHDVTWQWCILAEAKNTLVDGDPVPLKGVNGKGLIAGTEDGDGALMYNVSLHHNFMAHNYQRSPLVKGAGPFEIVNNLVYNWAAFGTSIDYTNAEGSKVNLIGNYYGEGPDAFDRYAVTMNDATHPADMIYVSDNISPQRTSGAQDEWDVMGLCDGSPYCNTPASTSYQKDTAWAASDYPITIADAVDVPALVLAGVGATLPARDATDTRIVSEYYLGTGSIHTYNSWPTITGTTPPTDADNDGMADSWETSEGVTNPSTVAANGYTNLENYINSLV